MTMTKGVESGDEEGEEKKIFRVIGWLRKAYRFGRLSLAMSVWS
jgi:hypothetical protein